MISNRKNLKVNRKLSWKSALNINININCGWSHLLLSSQYRISLLIEYEQLTILLIFRFELLKIQKTFLSGFNKI